MWKVPTFIFGWNFAFHGTVEFRCSRFYCTSLGFCLMDLTTSRFMSRVREAPPMLSAWALLMGFLRYINIKTGMWLSKSPNLKTMLSPSYEGTLKAAAVSITHPVAVGGEKWKSCRHFLCLARLSRDWTCNHRHKLHPALPTDSLSQSV